MTTTEKLLLSICFLALLGIGICIGRYQNKSVPDKHITQLSSSQRYDANDQYRDIVWGHDGNNSDEESSGPDTDPEDIPFNIRYHDEYGWWCNISLTDKAREPVCKYVRIIPPKDSIPTPVMPSRCIEG